jgi:hemolysin III
LFEYNSKNHLPSSAGFDLRLGGWRFGGGGLGLAKEGSFVIPQLIDWFSRKFRSKSCIYAGSFKSQRGVFMSKEKVQEQLPVGDNQTIGEEIANSIIHGIGALLSIAGLVLMVVFSAIHGTAIHVVAVSIFGASLILLYSASTIYHAITNPRAKRVLQIIDHSSIFILIAGTYTPFTLVSIGGAQGWAIFGVVWGMAVLGVVFKAFFTGRYEFIAVTMYLIMGWLIVIAIKPLWNALDFWGIVWLIAGGLSYSVGVIFYVWDRFPFAHSVWHLFVLAGSICHFFAVLFHVVP